MTRPTWDQFASTLDRALYDLVSSARGRVLGVDGGLNAGNRATINPGDTDVALLQAQAEERCNPADVTIEITAEPRSVVNNSTHLPRLVVRWGAGRASQQATVDLRSGLSLTLACSSYQLALQYDTAAEVGGATPPTGPVIDVVATAAYGTRPTSTPGDLTLTTQRQDLAAGAGLAAPIQVPRLATHVAFVTGAAPVTAQPLQLEMQPDAAGGIRTLVAPGRAIYVPLQNGIEQIDATDLTGLPQPNVALVFAIGL